MAVKNYRYVRIANLLLVFLLVAASDLLYGQIRCVTEEVESIRRKHNQSVPAKDQFEIWIREKIENKRNRPRLLGISDTEEEPFVIPVVVHVIHQGESVGVGTNISDAQILSQMEVLNEDYLRLNADTVRTQDEFLSVVGKMNVKFVLAKQDPDGLATNGIIRKRGSMDVWDPFRRDLIAAESYWPAEDYLNIWVVDLSNSYLGISQYPDINLPGLENEDKKNRLTDGVYVSYRAFGSVYKDPAARLSDKYDRGRTCTHEVGHWLGLRHVWGDDMVSCSTDDYIEDTPESIDNYNGDCPSTGFSCGSTDMVENYLYYTSDACMNAFTAMQVERMDVVLHNAPRRASLANSQGALPPDGDFLDLAIRSLIKPGVITCSANEDYELTIKNQGTQETEGFSIRYSVDGGNINTYQYNEVLGSAESVTLDIPGASDEFGTFRLNLELVPPDGSIDINLENNYLETLYVVDNSSDFIPLREDFQVSDPIQPQWTTINYDDDIGWELREAKGLQPDNISALINLYDYPDRYQLDWLVSPALDMTNTMEASLFFRASYARNIGRYDQLKVLASSDCGNTFNDVLLDLSGTALSDIISSDYWEPISNKDWQEFSVDLSSYAGAADVRIAFVSVNGQGNNIYLDNIEFYTTAEDRVIRTAENNFVLYPNPSRDGRFNISIYTQEREDVDIVIYSALGKTLYQGAFPNTLNQTYEFSLDGKPQGVYIIKIAGRDFVRSQKMVISSY